MVRATYLSFSEASGSERIFATWALCAGRSMNETSRKAVFAITVSASGLTFSMGLPSKSPTETQASEPGIL